MSRFFLRTRNPIKLWIQIGQHSTTTTSHLLPLHHHLRFLHKTHITPQDPSSSSFTVSYLINSCGLSPQSALSAAQKINLKSTDKADSILALLKSYGFTKTQITKLITKRPGLLASNSDKTIEPKLEFLQSVGYSATELAALVTSDPDILQTSLNKRLKPNFELLRSIFGANQQIVAAFSGTSWLLSKNLVTMFLPNVRILQHHRVPGPIIAKLAMQYPRILTTKTEQFKKAVDSMGKLGFNKSSNLFIQGMNAVSGTRVSTWERKVAVYKTLGFSEAQISSAFSKQPNFMLVSEEKIRRSMDFFAMKMHWGPTFVSANPVLLKLSLEKRVIPRCSVMNVLVSKGLLRRNSSAQFLILSEDDFLNKYVIKYQKQVPEVLQAYNGDLGLVALGGESPIA